jgi:hypothetical protein
MEQKKAAIEHEFQLKSLYDEAQWHADDALEWAVHDVEMQRTRALAIVESEQKIQSLKQKMASKDQENRNAQAQDANDDELKGILAKAEQDREDLDSVLGAEKKKHDQILQARLAQRKKKGALEASRKKERALNKEVHKVEDAARLGLRKVDVDRVLNVLRKLPEADRQGKAKNVIEMLLR